MEKLKEIRDKILDFLFVKDVPKEKWENLFQGVPVEYHIEEDKLQASICFQEVERLIGKGLDSIRVQLGGKIYENIKLESVYEKVATSRSDRIFMKYKDNAVIFEPSAAKKLEIVGDRIQYIN